MIISHKHKFILLRPRKVGGTSIEAALVKHCGPEDIITKEMEFSNIRDQDEYTITPQNDEGFYQHIPPKEIISKIGREKWNSYFKIGAVRNPWDLMVSNYWWENQGTIPFDKFVRTNYLDNDQFCFDAFDRPILDFYIRFENIDEDYKKLCEQLGFPFEPLPRTKTKVRKNNNHYSSYYTTYTKDLIARRYARDIKFFGYTFELAPGVELKSEEVSFLDDMTERILDAFRALKRMFFSRAI